MIPWRFPLGGGFADTPTAHTDDMQSLQHNGSMAGRAALHICSALLSLELLAGCSALPEQIAEDMASDLYQITGYRMQSTKARTAALHSQELAVHVAGRSVMVTQKAICCTENYYRSEGSSRQSFLPDRVGRMSGLDCGSSCRRFHVQSH